MKTRRASSFTRRDFLLRAAKAGASVTGAGLLGLMLYDGKGPRAVRNEVAGVTFADFSVPGTAHSMAVVTGRDRAATLKRALKLLGGVERFVRPRDRVLLKVNAAFATPPILSATTHPDLVAEMARLCFQAGASSVIVTDNPINDPASCFALTGIAKAAQAAGARVVLPDKQHFKPTTLDGGALIKHWPVLYGPFQGVDKVIGMSPVKDHHRSGASMAMKNWYGLLGGRRNLFHQDIHNIIKELAMMVRPTLVVLDGTTTMMTNGPTGGSLQDLKQTDTMIVSTDQVAADAFGATLLGRTPAGLPFIGKAEEKGVGKADLKAVRPIRDRVG